MLLGPLGQRSGQRHRFALDFLVFQRRRYRPYCVGRKTVAGMVLLVMGWDWIRLTFANIMPQKTNRLYLKISSSCPWP